MEHDERARAGAHTETSGYRPVGDDPALLDGALPLRRDELRALLRERSRLAAEWFVPIQRPDGSFPYTYDPDRDRYRSDRYNEVRHAGVTYALFLACQRFDDPGLHACARKAAEYIVDSSVSVPGGGAAFLYQGRCKLGGLALAIVALLEGRRGLETDSCDDAIAAMAQFLLGMEIPGKPGRYFQSFDAATGEKLLTPNSNYYPGEALLALARMHGAFPDGPWLAAARRAASYLIRVRDGDQVAVGKVPREDHWLTIALSELYRYDPNPDYATIVRLQAERMIGHQYGPDDHEPWRIGAGRRSPTPSFPATATQAEALNAAWELSRLLEDDRGVEQISQAALRSAQFLMRVQCTAANTARFDRPDRALGAWSQDLDTPHIRIDFVQHGLSALIGAWRMLDAETAPVEPPEPMRAGICIVESNRLERHNVWSPEAVLRLTVCCSPDDLGARLDRESAIDSIEKQLARLPGSQRHDLDSPATPAGAGMLAIGNLIGRSALAMQHCLGDWVSFSWVGPGQTPGEIEIVFGYRYAPVAQAAAELAVRLVWHAIEPTAAQLDFLPDWERTVAATHPSRTCRPEIRSLLAATAQRGVPVRSLDPKQKLVELGTGAYGRRFWNLSTSGTSHHGVKIAKDKHLASALLRDAGVPVPRSIVIKSSAEALAAAAQLGFPVVLKPNLGSQGRDVFVGIQNEAELLDLCAKAFGNRAAADWLVEQHVPGSEHRVLVIGGQVVAVNLRTPASVTGDGVSTVQALIATLNADPARSFSSGFALKPIVPGAQHRETLRRQGLDLNSVPADGRLVQLNSVSNVSAGGSARDVTGIIHPENARIACMAAEVVGLDFAGIDLIAPDIAQSILETGGAIIEINSHPGVIDHLQPGSGPPRDVGAAILDMLYPPNRPVRAPIVAVLRSEGSSAICRQIEQALATAGWLVGRVGTGDLAIGGMTLQDKAPPHPLGMRILLNNPTVEVAVLEVDPRSIDSHGLGVDLCDVVVIMSLSGLRTPFGEPVESVLMAALSVGGIVVLNRADPAVAALADRSSHPVVHIEGTSADALLPASLVDRILLACAASTM